MNVRTSLDRLLCLFAPVEAGEGLTALLLMMTLLVRWSVPPVCKTPPPALSGKEPDASPSCDFAPCATDARRALGR